MFNSVTERELGKAFQQHAADSTNQRSPTHSQRLPNLSSYQFNAENFEKLKGNVINKFSMAVMVDISIKRCDRQEEQSN